MKIEFEMSYGFDNSLLGLHVINGYVINEENDIKHQAKVFSLGFIFITFTFIFIA